MEHDQVAEQRDGLRVDMAEISSESTQISSPPQREIWTPPAAGLQLSKWTDLWLLFGDKGEGKSRIARYLWARANPGARGVKLCVDTMEDAHPPGAVTVRNIEQMPWEARTLRVIPPFRKPFKWLDRLCELIYERGQVYTWWDELEQLGEDVHRVPMFRSVILRGRHRALGGPACAPRPRWLMPSFRQVADHWVMVGYPDPDDLELFAQRARLSVGQCQRMVESLDRHEYLWWHRRDRRTYLMDRVPA